MATYLLWIREPGRQQKSREEKSMIHESKDGIVLIESRHSVDETGDRLKKILDGRGIKLFAMIDHSGAAHEAGLEMRPTKVLIFGNPKAGTPLMIASPTIAIDLPLKLLVFEDSDHTVKIVYNDPAYL